MKRIIAYFSWSNNTKKLVEEINKEFNYPIIRIERKIPYSTDYDICAYQEAKEEYEKNLTPDIKPLNINFNDYDEILLFLPIWWYTFPMPVKTFIKGIHNIKVIVFANSYTNDYTYMKNVMKDLKIANKDLNFVEGLFNKTASEHIKFLKTNN